MLLWSYFNVVLNDPGVVPPNWRPANDEEGGDGAPLVGSDQSTLVSDPANQKVRFCRKCNHFKPPRCHHCSVCEYFWIKVLSFEYVYLVVYKEWKVHCFIYAFDLRWEVHIENGPSLCVGGQLCWGIELQVLPSLLGMLAHYVSIEIFWAYTSVDWRDKRYLLKLN